MQIDKTLLPLAALASVLCLIWVIHRLMRAGPLRQIVGRLVPGARPGVGRLRLIETLPVDRTRRLLLLACDGRVVLVMTGGPNDLLIGNLGEQA